MTYRQIQYSKTICNYWLCHKGLTLGQNLYVDSFHNPSAAPFTNCILMARNGSLKLRGPKPTNKLVKALNPLFKV